MTIEAAFFGSLARDSEPKTSKNGRPYLRLNVRVENGEAAQFINVMAFDQDAVDAAGKLVKGARVYVEGKLSLDTWTGNDGTAKQGLSCMSFHTRLAQIGRAKSKKDTPQTAASGRNRAAQSDFAPAGSAAAFDDEIPFAPEFR